MKIKIGKTATCGYIYEDGHAVIVHRERHPKAGEVEWCEVIEKIDAAISFDGRMVFHNLRHDRRFEMAINAYDLRASAPSTENGSENTKKHGLAVGSFTICFKDGGELNWVRLPDVISDGLSYQPEVKEAFNPDWDEYSFWGRTRIAKVYRLARKEPETVAA